MSLILITRCTKDSRNCYNQQFTRLTQTLSYHNYGNIPEFLDYIKLLEEQIDATKGNLDDELWPEIVLAMTYVKNIRQTKALDGDNPSHAQQISNPNIQHLRVLGSTVYVRLHEEERALQSEKWKPRALRGTLVGYDGQTIYRVHIREQSKVIRTKDLRIFEDYETRASNNLPDYRNTSTFQGFLLPDNDDAVKHDSEEDRPPLTQKLPKRKLTAIISTPRQGRKVSDVDDGASKATDKALTPHNGREVKRVRNANPKPTSNTQMSDVGQRIAK